MYFWNAITLHWSINYETWFHKLWNLVFSSLDFFYLLKDTQIHWHHLFSLFITRSCWDLGKLLAYEYISISCPMDDIQKGTYHAISFEVHGKLLALNKISLITPKLQKAFPVNSSSSNVFLLPSWNINILSSCHTMGGCFTSSHNLRWCGILNRKTRNHAEAREVSFFLDFQCKPYPLFFGRVWLVAVGMPGRLNRFYQGSSRAVTATIFWSSTWEKRWRELSRFFEDAFSTVELLQWHPKEAVL